MNLLQLRFAADAVKNPNIMTALQVSSSAPAHLDCTFSTKLAYRRGWFLDIFIGATPFEPQREILVSTLLSQAIPFDITFSRIGVEGESVDTVYGIRRRLQTDIVWHDEAQSIDGGCGTEELGMPELNMLGIDADTDWVGQELMMFSSSQVRYLITRPNHLILDLANTPSQDALLRETARYLLGIRRVAAA